MSNDKILKWIECDGGPHLVLEKRLVDSWEATDCPLHYDKACEIEEYVGLIPVFDGYGVVISEDILKSTWIPAEEQKGGYLVVLNYIDEGINDNIIIKKIRETKEELFEPTHLKFSLQDDTLYLFAACDKEPNWIYGFSEIEIEPGTYTIDTIAKYSFGDSSFRIHRIREAKE